MTPTAFVNTYGPQAQAIQSQFGIPADLTLAIAANETGWGNAGIGVSHNAWFGVKGNGGNAGTISVGNAWEVINGQNVFVPSTFNAYTDFQSAAAGWVNFLQSNSRYNTFIADVTRGVGSSGLAQDLKNAGYATDPVWVDKLNNIMGTIRNIGVSGSGELTSPTPTPSTSTPNQTPTTPTVGTGPNTQVLDFGNSIAHLFQGGLLVVIAITLLLGGIYLIAQSGGVSNFAKSS